MKGAKGQTTERRVLILAPSGRDGAILCNALSESGIEPLLCSDHRDLCARVGGEGDIAVIADEALTDEAIKALTSVLARQPEWSDLPLIVMAGRSSGYSPGWTLLQQAGGSAEVMVLQRPVRKASLVSCVRAALQSRNRQYRMRDELIERKRTEAQLRASEHRYRTIGEAVPYGVWTCGPDGKCEYVSDSFLEMLGKTMAQVREFGWTDCLDADDAERTLKAWRRCVETGKNWDWENRFRDCDGQYRTVLSRGLPIRNDAGQIIHWVGINLDITARKKTEHALQESEYRLRLLNETLEQRVAERTELLEDQRHRLQRLATELTEAEERERRRLAQLLHDDLQQILVGARLGAELLAMQPDHGVDVRQAARKLEAMLREAIGMARGLSHELSPPALRENGLVAALRSMSIRMHEIYGLHVEVEGLEKDEPADERTKLFLFRAVQELLLNATKHADTDHARVGLKSGSGWTQVEVRDGGCGFDLAKKDELHATSGFGLFSIRERAEILGGTMHVQSAPGQGTCVTIRIPERSGAVTVPAVDGEQREDSPVADSSTKPARPRIRVVLVDDHKVMREGLRTLLAAQPGIEVVGEASNGSDAIRMVNQSPPDVVVMDISMPDMDGFQATQEIKLAHPEVRIIGLSMFDSREMGPKLIAAGADQYICKADPGDQLIAAIENP